MTEPDRTRELSTEPVGNGAVTDRDLSRAEAFGRLAAKGGAGVRACPYEADGDASERVLAARFVAAYVRAGGRLPIAGPWTQGAEELDEGWNDVRLPNGRTVAVQVHRRSKPVAPQEEE